MSESVACALQMINSDGTQQTRLFIRMIDKFFDLLNVKGPLIGKLKRKENSLPFKKATDERFKVNIFFTCMHLVVYNCDNELIKNNYLIVANR